MPPRSPVPPCLWNARGHRRYIPARSSFVSSRRLVAVDPCFSRLSRHLSTRSNLPHVSLVAAGRAFSSQSSGKSSPVVGATEMGSIERVTEHLEKPELDDRSYRVIRLPNKLEALLVHDPDTDKASASVNVNVGNFNDPQDLPGLFHGLEHLLFMGTHKVSERVALMSSLWGKRR